MSEKILLLLLRVGTNKKFWIGVIVVFFTLLALIVGVLTFLVTSMFSISTYPTADAMILATDSYYASLEDAYSDGVFSAPSTRPGYDEYRYTMAESGHSGHLLAAYLCARWGEYTLDELQATLPALIERQYTISYHETVEQRERIVGYEQDPRYPNDPDREIPIIETYDYRILTVSLSNNRLSFLQGDLNAEERKLFDLYRMFFGNKPYLFADEVYTLDDGELPDDLQALLPEDIDAGRRAVIEAALSGVGHIAYDNSQSRQPTGPGLAGAGSALDCSRFIKWAYWTAGFSDWDADATATYSYASCVRQISRDELQPGDIAMLEPSGSAGNHVRIYIGNGYWVESCYGHGACVNNWSDYDNGGHAYTQFWRYVGFG